MCCLFCGEIDGYAEMCYRIGMPRLKGQKPKKPLVITDSFLTEYAGGRFIGKPSESTDPYLWAVFQEFRRNLEPTVPKKRPKDADKHYRYSPKQMYDNVMKYFEVTIMMGNPLTLSGMARFLGMTTVDLFNFRKNENLHKAYDFIHDCVGFVEMHYELALNKKQNPAGSIFALKNIGWRDKLEIDAKLTPGALTDEERAAQQRRLAKFSE